MKDSGKESSRARKVLISGASIAGPTLAYWLDRFGFEVTVIERASGIRGGGYPIDVRGTAIDVIEAMGLLPELRKAHIHSGRISFLDSNGRAVRIIRPEELTGGEEGRDVELPRGVLTSLLYDLTRETRIVYRFKDSIEAMAEQANGVDVRFVSGAQEHFDLVLGADGLHSNTRRLVFGPEAQYSSYLGFCFAGFSMPNWLEIEHESMIYATPGKAAVISVVGSSPSVHAFLNFSSSEPPFDDYPSLASQRQLTAERLAGGGWEIPRMIAALEQADDLFFDTVSQIRMPVWSRGRVALTGDAAHAPSFLSGQGTSLALVSAYVLAGELAKQADYKQAFSEYERIIRPFAAANQALAYQGGSLMLPASEEQLAERDRALAAARSTGGEGLPGEFHARETHSSLRLPDYAGFCRWPA